MIRLSLTKAIVKLYEDAGRKLYRGEIEVIFMLNKHVEEFRPRKEKEY